MIYLGEAIKTQLGNNNSLLRVCFCSEIVAEKKYDTKYSDNQN